LNWGKNNTELKVWNDAILEDWKGGILERNINMERKNVNRGFKKLDKLHYQIENELIQLIKSVQNRIKDTSWNDGLLD